MTYFTDSPFERLMQRIPKPDGQEREMKPAPEGHFCFGCGNYGLGCVRPCWRDKTPKVKDRDMEHG